MTFVFCNQAMLDLVVIAKFITITAYGIVA